MSTLKFYGEALIARFGKYPDFPGYSKRVKEAEKISQQMRDECAVVAKLTGFDGIEYARQLAHSLADGDQRSAREAAVALLAATLAFAESHGWQIDAMIAETIASKRDVSRGEAIVASVSRVDKLTQEGKLRPVNSAFDHLERLLKRATTNPKPESAEHAR